MTTTVIPNRGRTESDRLTTALLNLTAIGQRPHCGDPVTSELWLSEHEAERAEACRLCRGCPVLLPCRDVGQYQSFGVYGGIDVTRRPGRAKNKP
jgi:Transcription factor WhiB